MAEPDLLIHLRRTDAPTPVLRVGLSLAERLGAWTSGLHVVPIAPAAFASPEAVALQVHEADALVDEARLSEPWWRAQLDARGLRGEWLVSQGDTVEVICHAARWSDLVVVERPQLNPDAPTGWGLVSRTVFGSAAPVVVVPDSVTGERAGARIVVAWNCSREAVRAIRGAMPLLARAEHVVVLEGEAVDAQFRPFKATQKDRGAALLDAARAESADLIVMGAWGHSRITELVLGGTTRYLFQSSDLPLLLAH
jgi:nucleotide-binding universal stress UspA family protein